MGLGAPETETTRIDDVRFRVDVKNTLSSNVARLNGSMIMATTTKTPASPATPAAPKAKRETVKMTERMKSQLDAQVLRRKLTLDDLSDLEQHIKRLSVFLGAPA